MHYPAWPKVEKSQHTSKDAFDTADRWGSGRGGNHNQRGKAAISHLEIRVMDLDPFDATGISPDALRLLHMFIVYSLFKDEPGNFDREQQVEADTLQNAVACWGLAPSEDRCETPAPQFPFDSIPPDGTTVFLRENSNISTGGDSIDYTDRAHPSYSEIASAAANALGVKITGLDMIAEDIERPAAQGNHAIIEMNFNPAIHIHCHPYHGENRKLDDRILSVLGFV